MKILVIGSGAREHAIAWKLSQSPRVSEIYVAPGNGGTALLGHNLAVSPMDTEGMAKAASSYHIDLAIVGPEAPLAAGVVGAFDKIGIPIVGPSREAADMEASKVFAKEIMYKYGIPCARSVVFSSHPDAKEYVKAQMPPVVIKADGLAGGKGVTIAQSIPEAIQVLEDLMVHRTLGAAGDRVVIEEHLKGREVTVMAFTDGVTVAPMIPVCDYKRVYDGDEGPNTGGMGCYTHPAFFSADMASYVQDHILTPAITAMRQEGRSYEGILYAGLILTDEGIKVLEFNARLGDPEAQAALPLLKTDLVEIALAVISQTLDKIRVQWEPGFCVGVVMASQGYPGSFAVNLPIYGLEDVDRDALVFHAGTTLAPSNSGKMMRTNGGRVLTVVAKGATIAEARERAYHNVTRIEFAGCHYRKDIALRETIPSEVQRWDE
ncbi:MAG: phosphoribosylamine--glycine ligase [Chloroflexi bacterium]|nr:phosphoribosylamine--glycine ligase [Chloroflexota bacterium]